MEKNYKYIDFRLVWATEKTCLWSCHNTKSGAVLGEIKWYGPWRQYCFSPYSGMVFNHSCLADIQDFIHLAEEEKLNRKILASVEPEKQKP